MRTSNSVDFWRGFALVTIFIDHVPGLAFDRFTYGNISVSDAAELFVFLAGVALRMAVASEGAKPNVASVALRFTGRALKIYVAQLFITVLAAAMIAAAAHYFDEPLILQWHNAGPFFEEPQLTQIGVVLLTHQLGYFNILPLYVVIMALAPLLIVVDAVSRVGALLLSFTLYIVTLSMRWNLPTWPVEGSWFLDPMAWQFLFVLGFSLARHGALSNFARDHAKILTIIGVPILIFGAVVTLRLVSLDPLRAPDPKLFFIFDKTFLTPPRLLSFLALAAVFRGLYRPIGRYAKPCAAAFSMLGRNSLNVFCVGSLLSLAGQILRYSVEPNFALDACVLGIGVGGMGATAWASEWRERLRGASRSAARS